MDDLPRLFQLRSMAPQGCIKTIGYDPIPTLMFGCVKRMVTASDEFSETTSVPVQRFRTGQADTDGHDL